MRKTTPTVAYALLAAGVLLSAARPALGASPTIVTGAGGGQLPEGTAYNGVSLVVQRVGLAVEIAADGTAAGDVHVTLVGASLPGVPGRVTVEGGPTSAALGALGQVTLSGLCTLTVAGAQPRADVPFTIVLHQDATDRPVVALSLDGVELPAVEVSAGRVTIR